MLCRPLPCSSACSADGGEVSFLTHSWVSSEQGARAFFGGAVALPQDTPAALATLRKQELESLRVRPGPQATPLCGLAEYMMVGSECPVKHTSCLQQAVRSAWCPAQPDAAPHLMVPALPQGTEAGPKTRSARSYGYQVYDDLSKKDKVRPPLGGPELPYPRHLANFKDGQPGPGTPWVPFGEWDWFL